MITFTGHILRKPLWQPLLFLGLALLVLFLPLPVGASAGAGIVFHVHAGRFNFWPAILQVNPGDRVTIQLTSTDVVHGLSIDGYDFNLTSDPGQTNSLTFIANRSGSFRIRCSVTCGAMHPFMIGKLQVGGNDFFLRGIGLVLLAAFVVVWRRRQ